MYSDLGTEQDSLSIETKATTTPFFRLFIFIVFGHRSYQFGKIKTNLHL